MEVLYNYRNNGILRAGLNELTEMTFGFSFENWYAMGFWEDCYVPFSMVDEESCEVIANIMANEMQFSVDGEETVFLQLGTVMTKPQYRNMGISAALFKKLMAVYGAKGFNNYYLFANDSVTEFYPKLGFKPVPQYIYCRDEEPCKPKLFTHVKMDEPETLKAVVDFAMVNHAGKRVVQKNRGLFGFWLNENDKVWYCAEEDFYIVAEVSENELTVFDVFSAAEPDYSGIAAAFGANRLILRYTPKNFSGFVCEEINEEDSTLFVMGDEIEAFVEKKLITPELSHT